jgi:hypothetical protein
MGRSLYLMGLRRNGDRPHPKSPGFGVRSPHWIGLRRTGDRYYESRAAEITDALFGDRPLQIQTAAVNLGCRVRWRDENQGQDIAGQITYTCHTCYTGMTNHADRQIRS